jgi:putative flippase GtrA
MALNEDTSASPRERTSLYERLRRAPFVRRILAISFVQRVLLPARGDSSTHKFIRYSMVSAVAIVISQVTILICAWIFGLSGIAANTIGALTATPASYELNRKWAWGKSGKSHLWREVVPFWALTLVGFLGSTGMVELADNLAKSHGITGLLRALLIMGASLFAYGVVWIVKFILFNRVIFVDRPSDVVVSTHGAAVAPLPNGSGPNGSGPNGSGPNGSGPNGSGPNGSSSPPRPVLEGQSTVGL